MIREYQFPSSSSKGVVYTTVANGTAITCNCPGFTKRAVRECKHTKSVAQQLDIAAATPVFRPVLVQPVQPTMFDAPTGFIEPMLASAGKLTIDKYDVKVWRMEEKYDGHRMIVKVQGSEVTAWSRAGNVRRLSARLVEECKLLAEGTYDGELVIPGGTSTDVVDLAKLDSAELVLFDILACGAGQVSCRDITYEDRVALLHTAFGTIRAFGGPRGVRRSESYTPSSAALQAIWDRGGEGVILKHTASKYAEGKRSKEWVKFKRVQAASLRLVGYEAGLLGPHSKLVLEDEEGNTISVKALNDHWRAEFDRNPARFIGCTVNIEFQERTRDGKYRHPMADHFPNGEVK